MARTIVNEPRDRILELLKRNGWVPNRQYTSNPDGRGYNGYFYISGDGEVALSLKGKVMTVHEKRRQFCKVMSMEYSRMSIEGTQLACGRLILDISHELRFT